MTVDTIVVGCTEDATCIVVSGSCEEVADVSEVSSSDEVDGRAVVVSFIVLVCCCCDDEDEELDEDVLDEVEDDDVDDVLVSDRLELLLS